MSDQLIRAISKDGHIKATAVSTRALTERARQIHKALPVATAALGRTLAAVSMMGNALKGTERCRNPVTERSGGQKSHYRYRHKLSGILEASRRHL